MKFFSRKNELDEDINEERDYENKKFLDELLNEESNNNEQVKNNKSKINDTMESSSKLINKSIKINDKMIRNSDNEEKLSEYSDDSDIDSIEELVRRSYMNLNEITSEIKYL
jgi:hypothetical protein